MKHGFTALTFSLLAPLTLFAAELSPAALDEPEVLMVPFRGGPSPATTTRDYTGEVWLCVRGQGQSADVQQSDAFFVFTNRSGQLLPPPGALGTNLPNPWHSLLFYNWVFWINGQSAETLILPNRIPTLPKSNVPVYNPAHVYAFPIRAPGGRLTLGVGDVGTSDNQGAYIVTIGAKNHALGAYLREFLVHTAGGYVSGTILLASNELYATMQLAAVHVSEGRYDLARVRLLEVLRLIAAEKGTGISQDLANHLLAGIWYVLGLL